LHNKWEKFISEFYTLRNSLVIADFDHHWMKLMNKYPEIQGYCDRRVESINHVIKLEANSGNSLCQLQVGIELQLKDEAKYASLQEFQNMNPTRGLPHVSNTIFKSIDNMCKKYLMPNSLALQCKQMLESLLYRESNYNVGFIEDDYDEPQVLLDIALEYCAGSNVNEIWEVNYIQSTTNHSQFILLLDDVQKSILQYEIIQNENKPSTRTFQILERIHDQEVNNRVAVELESKKVSYCRSLGFCKKALNIAITNDSNKALENFLQQFIDEQILSQCQNTYEPSVQELDQRTNDLKISDPLQHKGKGHPANKRYLSANENHDIKNVGLNHQDDETLESGSMKKNKRQCAMCKLWYHDS
ncbi:13533_t:CDS:2, partial [Racocetra persica]